MSEPTNGGVPHAHPLDHRGAFPSARSPTGGMNTLIGKTLSHYRIERELAHGGMGIVYLARDTRLNRLAAIKTLPDDVVEDADRLARFKQEAQVLASLNHPNIAAIYGLEERGDRHYLALQFVEGETLAKRIARGHLPINETVNICLQIASGIEAAHEGGIIRRDPYLSPDGRWIAYVTDEGARLQVYVAPYRPDGTLGTPLVVGNGAIPRWSRTGSELFFVQGFAGPFPKPRVVSVSLKYRPALYASPPVPRWNLDSLGCVQPGGWLWWDILPGDRLILVQRGEEEEGAGEGIRVLACVFNFFDELKGRIRQAEKH